MLNVWQLRRFLHNVIHAHTRVQVTSGNCIKFDAEKKLDNLSTTTICSTCIWMRRRSFHTLALIKYCLFTIPISIAWVKPIICRWEQAVATANIWLIFSRPWNSSPVFVPLNLSFRPEASVQWHHFIAGRRLKPPAFYYYLRSADDWSNLGRPGNVPDFNVA